MSYAIDTDAAGGVGDTLALTATALKDCAEALAFAGGLLRRGVGDDDLFLIGAVTEFTTTHTVGVETASGAFAALGRKVSWVGHSGRQVELVVAQSLGQLGRPAPAGHDGTAL